MAILTLPILLCPEEAIDDYLSNNLSDTEKAYIVAYLSKEGFSNRQIREALKIDRVYTVTHLKRAGSISEQALLLWLNHSHKIKLGHIRVITRLKPEQHLTILEKVIRQRLSVHQLTLIAEGKDQDDANIKRYVSQMAETIGRSVTLNYNSSQKKGSITLDFWSLDDLDEIAKRLGYVPVEEF